MKRKPKRGHTRLKTKLGLPDLEHAKIAVIVSLRSFESQRSYRHSIDEFVAGIAPLRDCRSTRRSSSVTDFISKIVTSLQAPSTSGWQPYDGWHMKRQILDC
jgi:hypothetical protein